MKEAASRQIFISKDVLEKRFCKFEEKAFYPKNNYETEYCENVFITSRFSNLSVLGAGYYWPQ